MRKYQLQQINDVLKTLYDATSEIKRLILLRDILSVTQLLTVCRGGAIQVTSAIEQIEGKGTETVSCLQEYCDILEQANKAVNDSNINQGLVKKLQKQLIKIEHLVKNELKPNKIEIVLFPYKAAMWDSLESIWLAAKDDPRCDAFVVPIPYYDLLPDRKLGKINYEGDQYPSYVPVTDWKEYSVEERRPDVIFIHNPYDDGNLVTSVHPNFYSKRLRSLTDMLVYVPYFVVADDVQKHFATTAGCVFAHKIFLQSEKVRSTYISEFKKFYGNNFGKPEDKFVALGSPKYDKAINTKREDCVLPEAWSKRIGSKKIILWNTSIGALLQGNEQYLKKLRDVINIFRDRDDAALWWRPHPLNEATYASMLPHLLYAYKQIIADYKREECGIYDDTADLHRAIAWADAYYGDISSLVKLFSFTGKPMMLQNINVKGTFEDNNESLEIKTQVAEGIVAYYKERQFEYEAGKDKSAYLLCFFEDDAYPLEQFISSLGQVERRVVAEASHNSGQTIWDYVKGTI